MTERGGAITFLGNPLTLVGPELKVGELAPDFSALDVDLNPVGLKDLAGHILVISVVPSLDTPVCDLQTRRFNAEAAALGPQVRIITLSMDLPFAQKRWCGAAEVECVTILSDHREASFGLAYGLLIKELRLLARAVVVVDQKGRIAYFQLVKEVSQEPDHEAAMRAVKALAA
ncbi:MAG: thiol peroxidase [Desulfarculus sp.]|nr:thiol peroxidase [Desulfarculus sp.]